MREILFKAKRIDNGKWVEGHLIQSPYMGEVRSWISTPEDKTRLRAIATYYGDWRAVEVSTDTICQYTGLTDKNGNKIWENDVVKFEDCEMSTESGYGDCFVNVGKIDYDTDTMSYFITDRITIDMEDMDIKNDVEVIGNAFDNTELIKGV